MAPDLILLDYTHKVWVVFLEPIIQFGNMTQKETALPKGLHMSSGSSVNMWLMLEA